MTQASGDTADTQAPDQDRWPAARETTPPRYDPFPHRIWLWLLPGLLSLALLGAGMGLLEYRASRSIVYVNSQGQLAQIRADDRDPPRPVAVADMDDAIFYGPQWAPNGQFFAATAITTTTGDLRSEVVVMVPGRPEPTRIRAAEDQEINYILPADAWSKSSNYLAVVIQDANNLHLSLLDIRTMQASTLPITISIDSNIRWSPVTDDLLIESLDESRKSTITIASATGSTQVVAPADDRSARLSPSWSPDGTQIAYVGATEGAEDKRDIWLVNRDASNPRQIVTEGLNLNPVWAPGGEWLFFSRVLTDTVPSRSRLYRVRPDGGELAEIGPGLRVDPGLDRSLSSLISWTPDGQRMFFLGHEAKTSSEAREYILFSAQADGLAPRELRRFSAASDAPPTIRWSPTGTALLVSRGERAAMILYWDSLDRDPLVLPPGSGPTWQPW